MLSFIWLFPPQILEVIAETVMPDIFVTTDTLAISFTAEITAMGAESHAITLRSLLQVLVAIEARGVVNKLFTALTNAMPVDFVGLLEQLHGWIYDAMPGLDPEVMQRIVMGKMAVVAGSSNTHCVIAAVDIFPVGTGYRFICMATGTELIVRGHMECSVQRCPTGYGTNAECGQYQYYSKKTITKKAHSSYYPYQLQKCYRGTPAVSADRQH